MEMENSTNYINASLICVSLMYPKSFVVNILFIDFSYHKYR